MKNINNKQQRTTHNDVTMTSHGPQKREHKSEPHVVLLSAASPRRARRRRRNSMKIPQRVIFEGGRAMDSARAPCADITHAMEDCPVTCCCYSPPRMAPLTNMMCDSSQSARACVARCRAEAELTSAVRLPAGRKCRRGTAPKGFETIAVRMRIWQTARKQLSQRTGRRPPTAAYARRGRQMDATATIATAWLSPK